MQPSKWVSHDTHSRLCLIPALHPAWISRELFFLRDIMLGGLIIYNSQLSGGCGEELQKRLHECVCFCTCCIIHNTRVQAVQKCAFRTSLSHLRSAGCHFIILMRRQVDAPMQHYIHGCVYIPPYIWGVYPFVYGRRNSWTRATLSNFHIFSSRM